MRYSAWGMSYEVACNLIKDLQAAGIEANITVGGVAIPMEEHTVNTIIELCDKHGAHHNFGETPLHNRTLAAAQRRLSKE